MVTQGSAAPDFALATQQTLGKLISRPQLTTRLLARPPFRFLYDILVEVAQTTQFGEGILDMDLGRLQTPGEKLKYLATAIGLVSDALGANVLCHPTRVLAGEEPRATNEFLQLLALVTFPTPLTTLPCIMSRRRAPQLLSPPRTGGVDAIRFWKLRCIRKGYY